MAQKFGLPDSTPQRSVQQPRQARRQRAETLALSPPRRTRPSQPPAVRATSCVQFGYSAISSAGRASRQSLDARGGGGGPAGRQ